jgi:hypothetical protein
VPSLWPCGTPARAQCPPAGHLPLHPALPATRCPATRRGPAARSMWTRASASSALRRRHRGGLSRASAVRPGGIRVRKGPLRGRLPIGIRGVLFVTLGESADSPHHELRSRSSRALRAEVGDMLITRHRHRRPGRNPPPRRDHRGDWARRIVSVPGVLARLGIRVGDLPRAGCTGRKGSLTMTAGHRRRVVCRLVTRRCETCLNQHRPHRSVHAAAPLKPLPQPVALGRYRVRNRFTLRHDRRVPHGCMTWTRFSARQVPRA